MRENFLSILCFSAIERPFIATVRTQCPFQLVKLHLQSTLKRSVGNTSNCQEVTYFFLLLTCIILYVLK